MKQMPSENLNPNRRPRNRNRFGQFNQQQNRNESVRPPNNRELPFFAYGIFKPNQLAYSKIEGYVRRAMPVETEYRMMMRDGVPILVHKQTNEPYTKGYLIYFNEGDYDKAYKVISKTEPALLYEWEEINIGNNKANALMGINPDMGSAYPEYDDDDFKGENDPFFKEALELIEENLNVNEGYGFLNVKKFFNLQMNYMLLWSAIERYSSLKYGNKGKGENNRAFANEKAFQEGLKKYCNGWKRPVYSSEDLREYRFTTDKPQIAIRYYYTLRCNVVHRGKAVHQDEEMLRECLEELLNIFKDVLEDTFVYEKDGKKEKTKTKKLICPECGYMGDKREFRKKKVIE